jgi:hypothetical protein
MKQINNFYKFSQIILDLIIMKFESKEELESLYKAVGAVVRYNSFLDSAQAIFNEAKQLIGAKSGYIALLSENGEENKVLFLDSGGLECTVDPSLPMPIRGLRSEAYSKSIAVMHNDFMKSDWVKFMPSGHVILNNVMFSPLIIEGKVVGIMGLANKATDFTEHDRELATEFGQIAAQALFKNRISDELKNTNQKLENALKEIKTLKAFLSICASCKRIRDENGNWVQIEAYISKNTDTLFSHSYCPECYEKAIQELDRIKLQK